MAPTSAPDRVLLVDDDAELVELFAQYLEREGFVVGRAHDGMAGTELALSGRYDIAVVDVMMPRRSGIELLQAVRASGQMPLLLLTAKGDDTDRILGLEYGADDYVPKPCTPRELAARLRAILRRTRGDAPGEGPEVQYTAGALTVDPQRRLAKWNDVAVDLTGTEFELLAILARNVGAPVSKQVLSVEGLGRPLAPFDRSVDVHVSSLRQKLGTLQDGRSCIQTVYRRGYQLVRD